MKAKVSIAPAAKTLAPSFALLKSAGFVVTRAPGSSDCVVQAEDGRFIIRAANPLLALGLLKLLECRGEKWAATDEERRAFRAWERELG